ncbi:hypothetical protein HYV71_04015 [Candidatus Uhrbacteria bacterium]|nr:hypothetical protein [Candidatus Uhrbacteria bacterium]
MPLSRFKKTILAVLAALLIMPVLVLGAPRQASAIVPVADAVEEKNFWADLAFGIIENGLYVALKGALQTLAKDSSDQFMHFMTNGLVGRQGVWEQRDWTQFGIDVLDNAASGAAEGYFLTVETMNRSSEAGIKGLGKDADRYDEIAGESEQQSEDFRAELDRDWGGKECEKYYSGGMTDEQAQANDTKEECDRLRDQYDTQLEMDNQADGLRDRAAAVRARIGQFNANEGERFVKYQRNRAGALSPKAASILRRACNPSFGLEFNLGLGLAAPFGQDKPVCKVSELFTNWTATIQGTGVAISDIVAQTGRNPWQTLSDAVDPRKSHLGIALAINQNITEEKLEIVNNEKIKRWLAEQEGFKPVTDLAGGIMTPAPYLKKVYEESVKEEKDVGKRLTGKALVDGADLVFTFVSTLIGNTTKLYFEGLRKKADEVNQLAGGPGAQGAEFTPTSISSEVIYNPSAAPQYAGAQQVIARRSASLAQVKTTSGDMLNILVEFQSQDCRSFPNACTLGPAFSRAIQEKLTIGEAMKKYRDTGGSVGLNPLGIFGYTSRQVEPTDFRASYPYHSMVVLRKYRVLPVAWELTALYIKEHANEACSGRDCTLQDLVSGFNEPSSPFYRLIDPNWVLKLPAVRCELKGYGPAAWQDAGGGAIREADPIYRPEVCVDERTWLHEGTPQDWERGNKATSNDDYGYCIEEKKVFAIKGTQCAPQFASCDTFAELDRDGKPSRTQFYLKDSLPPIAFAADQSGNVCKLENAGCSWLSTVRRQYETCVLKTEVKEETGPQKVKYVNKRQLLENKTLRQLWVSNATTTDLEDTSWKNTAYHAKVALCGTIREERPDGTAFTTAQEWNATSTQRVFLSYGAERCEAEFEGCRDLGNGDYLKIAPSYLKCDEPGAWQRGECQRYALHCTSDAVGCQMYNPTSRFESPVSATAPLACVSGQCVGLDNYLVQPSFFSPAESTSFHAFKAAGVGQCNAQSSGCEEFTNLAQERSGAEARTYFTSAISCEQQAADQRTVFYSYFGSEKGGRQPVPYSLKPNGTNSSVPDCVTGYDCTATSTKAIADNLVVCDESVFAYQLYNTSVPFACREFIASDGTVSYRLIDKLIYQTDDCAEYRRSIDQQQYAFSPSLSSQCAAQYKGCRTYQSTQAGNYKLAVRDVFDQSQGVGSWQVPQGVTTYAADTSLESEHVGGRSMRIQKKSGAPTSYEVERNVEIQKEYTYTFTLTARAQSSNTVTATLKDLDGGVDVNLGSATFSSPQWHYITFTAAGSPANSTATSTLSLVFAKGSASALGSGIDNSVYVDNIYLKEASGKTVYAIDTSIATEAARPADCRIAGSSTTDESDDIYQTGCQFYTDRNGQPFVDGQNKRVAHYGFQNVCPAAFVGCKDYSLGDYSLTLSSISTSIGIYPSQPIVYSTDLPSHIKRCSNDQDPATWDAAPWPGYSNTATHTAQPGEPYECYDEYIPSGSGSLRLFAIYRRAQGQFLVDEPKARCTGANNHCTAYGYPKNTQEGISITGNTATTTLDIQSKYAATSRKEEWQTVYYKITPEMIAASSTPAEFANGNAYKGGICKEAEIGCKAYDTATAKRYLKDPGKNVCQFFDTNQGDPRVKGGGWFYKACGKVSENILSSSTLNAIHYPLIACKNDTECAGLNAKYPRPSGETNLPVYTEKCDAYISCGVESDPYGIPQSPMSPLGPYVAGTSSAALPSAVATSYWLDQGPVSYAKQCIAKVSGCTEYQDPDCRPCGPHNEYCIDSDPKGLKGTLISDYGRFDPVRGQQGSQCQTRYYYLKSSEKAGTEECRNEVDLEKGCILFRGTGKDAPALTYNSTYYYNTYFTSKRAVTVNRADANNTSKEAFDPVEGAANHLYGAQLRDANVVLKANLDRACNVPLVCASEIQSGDATQCLERLPCLIENEFGGCQSLAFSGKKACKGAVISTSACNIDADCVGVVGAIAPVQCVFVGVCDNSLQRCTDNSNCGGAACVTQDNPNFATRIKAFCEATAQSQDEYSCNQHIECFWNSNSVSKCRAKDTSALQEAFLTPKTQNVASAAALDLSYTMLSGYAHPNLQFAAGENRDPLSRDSFFDWGQMLDAQNGLGGADSKANLQNTIDTQGYKVANSCRLYPRVDAPYRVGDTTWNDACNYVTGGEGEGIFRKQKTLNVGLYGYCLEPYPRFKSKFEKQWTSASDPLTLATFTTTVSETEQGSYELGTASTPDGIYNPYRYACLLWHPIDKPANQSMSGIAGADIGGDIMAYKGTNPHNIYVCVGKSNANETSSMVGAADKTSSSGYSFNPYSNAATRSHALYEGYASGACDYAATCTTRNSSSWRAGSDSTANMSKNDDEKTRAALNTDQNILIVATELKSNIVDQVGATAAVMIMAGSGGCGVGAAVGSVVPVIGNAIGCIGGGLIGAAGGLIWGIVAGGRGTDDSFAVIPLNGTENPKGLSGNSFNQNGPEIHFDAIEKIEYTIEAATRVEFRDIFNGGQWFWDCNSGTTQCEHYRLLTGWNISQNGNTLTRTDSPKKPVGMFYQHDWRSTAWCDPSNNGGSSLCAFTNTESFFDRSSVVCEREKNFMVVGPVVDGDILRGWRWRYCDKSGSNKTEAVAVSIKITFKKVNHTVHHLAQDEYTNYCTSLLRVVGSDGRAVTKYGTVGNKDFTQANPYLSVDGKNFLIGDGGTGNPLTTLTTRLSYLAKRYLWDRDEFYTENSQHKLKYASYGIASSQYSGKDTLLPGSVTPGIETWTYEAGSPANSPSSILPPKAVSSPHSNTPLATYRNLYFDSAANLQSSTFGKVYEKWDWNGSQYEKVAWPNTNGAFAGSQGSVLQSIWDTSKTSAQANRPTIYNVSASSTEWFKRGAADQFTFEHNKRTIYQKVAIQFYVDANPDQLPLRKIIVDWGDYPSSRDELVNSDTEGTGKNHRPGPIAYSNTAADKPFLMNKVYRDTPVGKTICVYVMDNWEAKSAVCGTIEKKANGDLHIPSFAAKRGADYSIGINPTTWPPKTQGRCDAALPLSQHSGVDESAALPAAGRFACPF